MPHLHIVLKKPAPFHGKSLALELGQLTSKVIIDDITNPCTLQLHHLALSSSYISIPEHINLPQLQSIYISNSFGPYLLDASRFPKLTEMSLYFSNVEPLFNLGLLGHNLRHISVTVNAKVELDRLLYACPHLTELTIFCKHLDSTTDLQPDTLLVLQQFLFVCYSTFRNETVQEGLIVEVLRLAPELRVFKMKAVMLGEDELMKFADLAEQRICLRKLEEVHLKVDKKDMTTLEQDLLDAATISLATHCERLRILEVIYEDSGYMLAKEAW